jgi:ribosomal protein L33
MSYLNRVRAWRCELVCQSCGDVFYATAARDADGRLSLDALCARCRAEAGPAVVETVERSPAQPRPRTLRETLAKGRREQR